MKTAPIELENFVKSGTTLLEWMGYFWTRIYENTDLAKSVQQSQGLFLSQLYLDFTESVLLLNRNEVPVFHRERWKPLTIKLSQAGLGDATLLTVGMNPTPVVGPQIGPEFIPNEVFPVGGNAEYLSSVSYPLNVHIEDVMTCVTDNILTPKTVLVRGKDFLVQNDTIIFLRKNDPFTISAFPQRSVGSDKEILLWACDTLIDKEYVYRYLSYVLGIKAASTEFFQTLVNGLWNLYNYGTPISLFKSTLGAILGEPTVVHTSEIVENILINTDNIQVLTDKEVYTLSPNATLRVEVGDTLSTGEYLTKSIRLYETLDPMKLDAVSEFGVDFKHDVHSLFFEKAMLRSKVRFGVGASYDESDIVVAGLDNQGNPQLKFTLYGEQDDLNTFWTDFWQYLEDHSMTSETCLQDYIDDIVIPIEGTIVGHVPPLEFFLRYFMRANAMVLVVDREKLAEIPAGLNPIGMLQLLRPVLPAHIMLLVVEHLYVEESAYDLTDLDSTLDQMLGMILTSSAEPGGPSTETLTYKDRPPVMRWIPQCR